MTDNAKYDASYVERALREISYEVIALCKETDMRLFVGRRDPATDSVTGNFIPVRLIELYKSVNRT